MRILAIDPGPTRSAWVLLDGAEIKAHYYEHNNAVEALLKHTSDHATRVVIEMIASYGMPVGAEVFETCVWIGRFLAAAEQNRLQTERITRVQVKSAVCHSTRATDANVRQAMIDRFGKPGTKKKPGQTYGFAGDQWAALAVGVAWMDKQKEEELCTSRTAQS